MRQITQEGTHYTDSPHLEMKRDRARYLIVRALTEHAAASVAGAPHLPTSSEQQRVLLAGRGAGDEV